MPADLLETFEKDIGSLVESMSEKDAAGKQSLVQLLTGDAASFCAASIRVLGRAGASPGARFVTYLLTKEKLLIPALLDARMCSLEEALAAARAINAMGAPLEASLEIALSRALRDRTSPDDSTRVIRILELVAAVAGQDCWPSFQTELMAHPDAAVRSKAALLIGRNTRNTAWISRRLMDRDARVQANAVEAMWELDPDEARPLLATALRSPHRRVAANAALGLYRLSDLKAIRFLLDMAKHSDPAFRPSAFWAIGETEDSRFVPFLMEQFKSLTGKSKLAVTRALSRIRQREKANSEKGTLQVHISVASVQQDGRRRLVFTLSRTGASSFSGIKPTDFALWEEGKLIEEYEVKLPSNPAVLVTGLIVPRFTSSSGPSEEAVTESLKRLLAAKRADDLWRIDRYATAAVTEDPNAQAEKSTLPYDDALATQELKNRQGFTAEASLLEKAISLPVPRDRAAADVMEAISRQCDAMHKNSGKRHVFVFAHESCVNTLDDPEHLGTLKKLVQNEGLTLHGICPVSADKFADFRNLCVASPDGTFTDVSVDKLAGELEQLFSHLLNQFEIRYTAPSQPAADSAVVLQISSDYGVGRAEFSLSAHS